MLRITKALELGTHKEIRRSSTLSSGSRPVWSSAYKKAKAATNRTLEVETRIARRLGLASPVAAVHPGQGHRAQRAAERVDKQSDRPGFGRHAALEHLNGQVWTMQVGKEDDGLPVYGY